MEDQKVKKYGLSGHLQENIDFVRVTEVPKMSICGCQSFWWRTKILDDM